jgi:hypothetical protein
VSAKGRLCDLLASDAGDDHRRVLRAEGAVVVDGQDG